MALWTPADETTWGWWDATDASTIDTTLGGGGAITSWTDKSGNGRDLTASGGTVPGSVTYLGDYCAQFLGSDYATAGDQTSPSSYTAYAMIAQTSTSGRGGVAVMIPSDGSSTKLWPAIGVNGGELESGFADGTNYYFSANTDAAAWGTAAKVCLSTRGIVSGATVPNINYVDANPTGIISSGTPSGNDITTNFSLGRYGAYTNGLTFQGYIYEVVIMPKVHTDAERERVEGYLAWKYGVAADLPSGHTYKNGAPTTSTITITTQPVDTTVTEPDPATFTCVAEAGDGTSLWSPADTTTEFWLDATDASTVTGTSPVTAWADKSGNAVSTTVVGTPTSDGTRISFSGVGEYILADVVKAQPFTILLVADGPTNTSNIYLLDSDGANRVILGEGGSNGFGYFMGSAWVRGGTDPGTEQIFSLVGDGASSELFYNGESQRSGDGGSAGLGDLVIGAGSTYDQEWVGTISEVIVLANNADRQITEGYLAWKWGLEADLPIGHPYKDAAPEQESLTIYYQWEEETSPDVWETLPSETASTFSIDPTDSATDDGRVFRCRTRDFQTDPYWDDVFTLLRFNEANGSTTFTDIGSNGSTWTTVGGVDATTASTKWYDTSVRWDGNADYLRTAKAAYQFLADQSQDYTLDYWINPQSFSFTGSRGVVIGVGSSGATHVHFMISAAGNPYMQIRDNSSNTIVTQPITTPSLAIGTWTHVAFQVDWTAETVDVWIDGVHENQESLSTLAAAGSFAGSYAAMGAEANILNTWYANHYLQDFRITKNLRYTAGVDFTPPSGPALEGET